MQVRARILAAARAEFTDGGYEAASLARVARRAGFTKGAVYSNFESKQALLAAMLVERSAEVGRRAFARLGAEPIDPGTLAYRAAAVLADEVTVHPQEHQLLWELAQRSGTDADAAASYGRCRERQQETIAAELRAHLTALDIDSDADLDHAAFVLVTVMSALAVEHVARPNVVGRERIRATLDTVLRGLLAPSAAARGTPGARAQTGAGDESDVTSGAPRPD